MDTTIRTADLTHPPGYYVVRGGSDTGAAGVDTGVDWGGSRIRPMKAGSDDLEIELRLRLWLRLRAGPR